MTAVRFEAVLIILLYIDFAFFKILKNASLAKPLRGILTGLKFVSYCSSDTAFLCLDYAADWLMQP
jgi:hypothetical protein